MEGLIALFVVVTVLALVGLVAVRFGVDSRPAYRDDWARSVAR